MPTGNGYFQHDPSVIDYAYTLVKELDQHDREQDRLYRKAHPYTTSEPKNRSKQGGMIEAGTRKEKNKNDT
jgi:hypothetical protein